MRGRRPGLVHMPGADGVRGLAVAGVVAYHADVEVMRGGFLGVSTFFTLSGFLITSLLLAEARQTGGANLRAFWSRRFRRLLPASTAVLALVVLFGHTVATPSQRLGLRGDVLASLFQVANWRFVLGGTSYGAMSEAPSPVLHFWSLAIEEQFYWIFPPVLVALVALTAGRRGLLGACLGLIALVSWALPLLFDLGVDRVYFGTDTRMVEMLLGAILAIALSHEEVRRRIALRYRWRAQVITVGAVCLAVQLWWWTVPQSASWLYDGGLGLYGLMSCAVILAAALPTGFMTTVMSVPVLRWLGERSYGIYLIHWPLFLLVRQRLPELGRGTQTVIVVVATFVLAEVSYRFFEQPIRRGRWPARGTGTKLALPAVAVVALLALVPMTVPEEERPFDFEAALEEYESRTPPSTAPVPTQPPTSPAPEDPPPPPEGGPVGGGAVEVAPPPAPSLATFGDSTALLMAMGFDAYSRESGAFAPAPGKIELGCGVSRFESLLIGHERPARAECREWPMVWSDLVTTHRPDIAQLITGVWEITEARPPGASAVGSVGNPQVDRFVTTEMLEAVDTLSQGGSLVVLVLWPPDDADDGPDGRGWELRTPPERMERFHELLRDVAAERPDTARVVDLAGWFGDRATDPEWRSDGRHIEAERAAQVYEEWLGPEMLRVWQDWWRDHHQGGG